MNCISKYHWIKKKNLSNKQKKKKKKLQYICPFCYEFSTLSGKIFNDPFHLNTKISAETNTPETLYRLIEENLVTSAGMFVYCVEEEHRMNKSNGTSLRT